MFIGIALLAKGLIGILFPFAIVAFFYVISRRMPGRTFMISLIWGTLLAAAIASVWYLPMYERHGYAFIDEFIVQQHFQRFTSNKYQHPQPFYFFLWVLPLMLLPWLPFFFAAIWNVVKKSIHHRGTEDTEDLDVSSNMAVAPPFSSSPLLLFSAAWLLVPLAFFSLSGSKLPGYILPAVPPALVLTAAYIHKLVQNSSTWRGAVLLVAGGTFVVSVGLFMTAVPRFAETDSVRSLIQAANDNGYTSNRVVMLHTLSHNAEFYAAGRLLRNIDGKQRRLTGVNEVEAVINAEQNVPVLVLVPIEYVNQLTGDADLNTRVLKDNGELAIAAVSIK